MNTSLFSIITVNKNHDEGLYKTYKSLDQQSYDGFEWVVIDGGSEDGSVPFLQSSLANWISEPDNGIYDAMNKGIEKSKNAYLIFMNSGDCFAQPNVLSDLKTLIEMSGDGIDFVYGDAKEEIGDNQYAYKRARSHKKADLGMFTHHQAMVYHQTLFKNNRYDPQYGIAADYDLTLRCLNGADKVLYYPAPICVFEKGGISQRAVKQGRDEQFKIRQTLKTTSPLKNRMIHSAQAIASSMKQHVPSLYWSLKAAREK